MQMALEARQTNTLELFTEQGEAHSLKNVPGSPWGCSSQALLYARMDVNQCIVDLSAHCAAAVHVGMESTPTQQRE